MTQIFNTEIKVSIYNRSLQVNNPLQGRKVIFRNVDWIGVGIDYCEGESYRYSTAICKLEDGRIVTPRLDQIKVSDVELTSPLNWS
jgi:hypothetical protein